MGIAKNKEFYKNRNYPIGNFTDSCKNDKRSKNTWCKIFDSLCVQHLKFWKLSWDPSIYHFWACTKQNAFFMQKLAFYKKWQMWLEGQKRHLRKRFLIIKVEPCSENHYIYKHELVTQRTVPTFVILWHKNFPLLMIIYILS